MIAYREDRGFAIFDGVLSGPETKAVLAAVDALAGRSRAGARHLLALPPVAALAGDTRLTSLARNVLGRDATPFLATLFDKSQEANWLVAWHQDTALPLRCRVDAPGWGPWSVKRGVTYAHAPASALGHVVALRIHLEDSTAANGPLRVLPGTHRFGVLTDATINDLATTVRSVDCVARRGGVVVMRPLLVHASSKSASEAPRRVLHIEYASMLDFGSGLELAIA